MFGLPLEIVGPVLGIGAIISFITAGIVVIRRFAPGRQQEPDPDTRRQLEELQHRVGELEELKTRMIELEERVDFSERLLTRPPERRIES